MAAEPPRISVVIPTYQRREQCKAAVTSALEQVLPPIEVVVCDDGSTDGTEEELRAWESEERRLRYLRLPENLGTPAPARNLGIQRAQGEWIALLDSDDRWLPEKLAVQSEYMSSDRYDVVASDAERASGGSYLGLREAVEPTTSEFLRHNPIVVSTAVVRRSLLISAGCFPRSVFGYKIRGVEDYGLWLKLAYRRARFVVVPGQLIIYADASSDRMSRSTSRQEAAAAAVRWGLWLRRPYDPSVLGSALRGTLDAARWRMRDSDGVNS